MWKLITPSDSGWPDPCTSLSVLWGPLGPRVAPLNEVPCIFYEEQVILFSQIKTAGEGMLPGKQARQKMPPPLLLFIHFSPPLLTRSLYLHLALFFCSLSVSFYLFLFLSPFFFVCLFLPLLLLLSCFLCHIVLYASMLCHLSFQKMCHLFALCVRRATVTLVWR